MLRRLLRELARKRTGQRPAPAADPNEPLELGRRLLAQGDPSAAIPPLERAAFLAEGGPLFCDALLELARAHVETGQSEAAQTYLRRLLEVQPGHPVALRALATLLYRDSSVEEARALEARIAVSARDASVRLRRALMLPTIMESREHIESTCRRFDRELDELLDARLDPLPDPAKAVAMTAFSLSYYGVDAKPLLTKLARVVRRCYPTPIAHAGGIRRPRKRRARVGFVSTYFHTHSVGRTTLGWVRDLPREHFEVWLFSIAPPSQDALAAQLRGHADRHVEIVADLETVRRTVADAELDFLIFADIGMHPLTYYLAFWRLAPVQLAAWGHSETSGIDTVDYFISAASLELPSADAHYNERLLRLKGYFMPRYSKAMLERPANRAALGLEETAHLYVCPQTTIKMHPDFDEVIEQLLARDASALILLLDFNPAQTRLLQERFARRLRGLARRVQFLPLLAHSEFINLLACSDVVLDTFPFGGCNSTAEALALGVPVVTLPARYLKGRYSQALYRELGIDSCIASTPAQYIDIALRLANEREARQAISGEIARVNDCLFDRADAGLALGEALLGIV